MKVYFDRETFNSIGKFFRQIVLLGTQNTVLTILSKLLRWNQSFSLIRLRKNQQDCFLGKIFLFKMFNGQEKCSFHNSYGKKSLIRVFRPKVRKLAEILEVLRKKFITQSFLKTPRIHFWHSWPKVFFLRIKPSSAQTPKRWTNLHILAKSFLLKVYTGYEKCKLNNYAELNSLNSDFFLVKAPKNGRKCTLFTKITFPRNVCWTGEKQYWQVCRNKFAKLRSFFCSKPKKIDKFVFILPIDLTWKFLMDTKKQFWQPCRNIFAEVEIFFGSKCGKVWTILWIFQWNDFSTECFVDIKQWNFDNSAATISQKSEVLSDESRNWSKNC